MVGSACFALGSFPLYFNHLPGQVVGITFFVGSLFFTSAGLTQLQQIRRDPGDRRVWWATVIQLVGMIFFNVNTFRAAFVAVPADDVDRLVWAPDFYGSVAFLVASHFAWLAVCRRIWCVRPDSGEWWVAALNYVGSIFFMLSAVGAYTLPETGDVVNMVWANAGTFVGAVAFLLGGYLLLPARPAVAAGPT